MTQVVLTIKSKSDLPFLRKLSKNMGWSMSRIEEPNEATIAAMKEVESSADLETFDLDGFHNYVSAL